MGISGKGKKNYNIYKRVRCCGTGNVLSESFLHLLLWPIFCQLHPNFINVHTVYASEIWAQLTKNLLTKSSTKRFREYIYDDIVFVIYSLFIHYLFVIWWFAAVLCRNSFCWKDRFHSCYFIRSICCVLNCCSSAVLWNYFPYNELRLFIHSKEHSAQVFSDGPHK